MQMEQGGGKAGTLNTCIRIVQGEGVLALYNGVCLMKNNVDCDEILMILKLSAGFMRQCWST